MHEFIFIILFLLAYCLFKFDSFFLLLLIFLNNLEFLLYNTLNDGKYISYSITRFVNYTNYECGVFECNDDLLLSTYEQTEYYPSLENVKLKITDIISNYSLIS